MKRQLKKLISYIMVSVMMLQINSIIGTAKNISTTLSEERTEGINEFSKAVDQVENYSSISTEGDMPLEELKTAVLDEHEVPEVIGINKAKEKNHVNRLYAQEDDLCSVVFQNNDGTKTMYMFQEPVKYIDKNGIVKDKSTKLSEVAESKNDSKYTTTDNDINAVFPKNIFSGLSIQYNDIKIMITPVLSDSLKNIKSAEKIYSKIPSDNKETNRVTYGGVFGANTELTYTPTNSGIKEDIILNKFTGQFNFKFILNTNGLSLCKDKLGSYYLVDPLTGVEVASIGSVVTYDSNGKISFGEISSEMVIADNEYIITLIVDETFLKDENTVYPVYIDPDISIYTMSGDSKILDAVLYSGHPDEITGTYYSTNYVGYMPGGYGISRSLMSFPSLYNSSIFKNSNVTINNAFLQLYCSSRGSATEVVYAYPYTGSNWTEKTANCTANNMNSYTTNYSSGFLIYSGYYNAFNVTNMARAWKNGSVSAEKGLILISDHENYSSSLVLFSSSESMSNKPYIDVTYTVSTPTTETAGIAAGVDYMISNEYSGYLVEVGSTAPGTIVVQAPFTTSNNSKKYRFEYVGSGEYEIMPYLSISSDLVLSIDSSFTIITEIDSNLSRQRWYIYKVDESKYVIVNKAYPNKYLSPAGSTETITYLHAHGYITGNDNVWTISPKKSIAVRVVDSNSNPIKDARVDMFNSNQSGTYPTIRYTNKQGYVFFSAISSANYGINARADEYAKKGYITGVSSAGVALPFTYSGTETASIQLSLTSCTSYPDYATPYPAVCYTTYRSPITFEDPFEHGQQNGWRMLNGLKFHAGVDLSKFITNSGSSVSFTTTNAQIYSITTSYCEFAGSYGTAGNAVMMASDYDNDGIIDYYIKYYHLTSIAVIESEVALPDQSVIGMTGKTGGDYGVHLHLEISTELDKDDSKIIDPYACMTLLKRN